LRKEVDYKAFFETDEVRPVAVRCDDQFVYVTLADERTISVPLWWYPFLLTAQPEDRSNVELTHVGVWWTAMDEGISVKSMLLGWKMPRAKKPNEADQA
jgi:hypothetical protein